MASDAMVGYVTAMASIVGAIANVCALGIMIRLIGYHPK